MKSVNELFFRFSRAVAVLVAHPLAFVLAVTSVVLWAALGPVLHYSESWQLIINTSTTILTFLMVFVLQNTQNRDSRAVQVKLDELLRAIEGARNELIDLEDLSEEELSRYCREFHDLHRQYAQELTDRGKPHLVEAAKAAAATAVKKSDAAIKRSEDKPPPDLTSHEDGV